MKYAQVFTFLTILLFGAGCNGPDKKGLTKEKKHPKLIITGGNRYTYVECGLQDKAGNLWFGTQVNGLYKYDGKSFSQFLVTNGLNSNNIYCILEDKDGKIWIGTEAGLCLYDGKTFANIQIPLSKKTASQRESIISQLALGFQYHASKKRETMVRNNRWCLYLRWQILYSVYS